MLASFLTVSQQVIILFLLIGVGFVCGKTKFLADTAVTGMTDFVLYRYPLRDDPISAARV